MRRPERLKHLLLPLLLAGTVPCEAANETSPQARLDAVEKAIDATRQRQDEAAKLADALASELAQLQAQSVAAAESVQAHEAALSRIDLQLSALAVEERTKREALAHDRAHETALLMALARFAAAPRESIVLAPAEPVAALRGALLMGRAVSPLAAEAETLKREIAALATVRGEIETARAERRGEATALGAEDTRMSQLIARKMLLRQAAAQTAEAARKRAAALGAEAVNLRELIDRLEAERQKAAAEAERKLRPEPEAPKDMVAVTAPPPVRADPNAPRQVRPFAEARGGMVFPATGTLIRRWGAADEFGQPSRGLTFEVRPGAVVVAPFDGQVLFAGPFRGYGQILIIGHGDGYHSLLAGLDRLDSSVGQWLVAGEPIGAMPDGSGNARLYLELRHNNQPINPAPWLTTRVEKVNG